MFPSFSVSFLFSFFSVLFLLHFEEKNAKSESVNRVSLDPVQNLCLLDENPAVSQKERGIRNWTIVLKPKQEMAIYSLLQRRDVMESFGKSMIFTVFAMAKEEISSSKTYMITISPLKSTIDDQISEMLSLSCTAMDLMTETVNFSASRQFPSIFSTTRC